MNDAFLYRPIGECVYSYTALEMCTFPLSGGSDREVSEDERELGKIGLVLAELVKLDNEM